MARTVVAEVLADGRYQVVPFSDAKAAREQYIQASLRMAERYGGIFDPAKDDFIQGPELRAKLEGLFPGDVTDLSAWSDQALGFVEQITEVDMCPEGEMGVLVSPGERQGMTVQSYGGDGEVEGEILIDTTQQVDDEPKAVAG